MNKKTKLIKLEYNFNKTATFAFFGFAITCMIAVNTIPSYAGWFFLLELILIVFAITFFIKTGKNYRKLKYIYEKE